MSEFNEKDNQINAEDRAIRAKRRDRTSSMRKFGKKPDADTTDNAVHDSVEDKNVIVEVIGIKFKNTGKVYYFDPSGTQYAPYDFAIVQTARGVEFGNVAEGNKFVPQYEVVAPLRPAIRKATKDDIQRHEHNVELEKEAYHICQEKIREHGLEMKLIDAQYTFDNSKLLFHFSADGRVDFRELVKDLASIFRTRIELRQIGIRDEAKMMGGLGICGRPLCCSSFLTDFVQVSIKMAKEQNLSLNSSKISGTCGRLMCCLRYESQAYEEELKLTPPVDSRVKTSDGVGVVTEIFPLTGMIKVLINDEKNGEITKNFHRDDVQVLIPGKGRR